MIKISENKHTKEDLKTMQSWSLERKIQVTQTRIIEWYEHWGGKVYVSFSGGKDSTVLLDLARRIYPDIEAVFVDTGLEYPEIKEFVRTKQNVTWLKPKMSFRQVIEKYGYPVISKNISQYIREAKHTKSEKLRNLRLNGRNNESMFCIPEKHKYIINAPFEVSEKCCDVMKKRTIYIYEKNGKYSIIGTMASEGRQRKVTWMKQGCNAFDKKHPSSQPLSFWTEQDILQYIKQFDIPYASVYGDILQDENSKYYTTGCDRTGCMFCMFGCHLDKEPNRFQRLRQTHPKIYEYCMKDWDDGGLGLSKVLDYIGVKY